MEIMRLPSLKSRLSQFGRNWLNEGLRASGKSPLQLRSKTAPEKPSLRPSRTVSQLSVVDLLEVNAELPYTTVVEGLEEFLYQSELSARV